jgi:hypothetical protein
MLPRHAGGRVVLESRWTCAGGAAHDQAKLDGTERDVPARIGALDETLRDPGPSGPDYGDGGDSHEDPRGRSTQASA